MIAYCPRCEIRDMDEDMYGKHLTAYINALPEEIKAPPGEYLRRRTICLECEERIGRTCALCGCYFEMRAAKRAHYCPSHYWI